MSPTLIVTRPLAQAQPWVQALRQRGCDAVALPLMEIHALDDTAPLRQAWGELQGQALVVFVSANAVSHFFAACPMKTASAGHVADSVWPDNVLAGSTGPGTTQALLDHGVPAAQVVQPDPLAQRWDTEALWLALQARRAVWAGLGVWVVRGEQGRDWLADTLRGQGARLRFVTAYKRATPQLLAAHQVLIERALQLARQHVWLFSSSEAITNLRQAMPAADWSNSQAWATHARIAQTAREAGFGVVHEILAGVDAAAQRCLALAASGRGLQPGLQAPHA